MCQNAGVGVSDSDVLNAPDIGCGDTDGVSGAYDVEKPADPIDLPTCHLVSTDIETHGNAKARCHGCSECGGACEEIHGEYGRCPHRGAVVADE